MFIFSPKYYGKYYSIAARRSESFGGAIDMFTDMDIKDKIHNLKMQIEGVRPMDSYIECVGCGS
jgi:hypothetical protein